jgi:hypothetical protein
MKLVEELNVSKIKSNARIQANRIIQYTIMRAHSKQNAAVFYGFRGFGRIDTRNPAGAKSGLFVE